MAVVDLEKLTLVGLNVEKDRILERLMAVGVVHLNDLDLASSEVLAQWSHLITKEDTENAVAELDTEIEQTKQALDRLAKYVGDKRPCLSLNGPSLSMSLPAWHMSNPNAGRSYMTSFALSGSSRSCRTRKTRFST